MFTVYNEKCDFVIEDLPELTIEHVAIVICIQTLWSEIII